MVDTSGSASEKKTNNGFMSSLGPEYGIAPSCFIDLILFLVVAVVVVVVVVVGAVEDRFRHKRPYKRLGRRQW